MNLYVEDTRHQFPFFRITGNSLGSGNQHLVVDPLGMGIQRPTKDAGKVQGVIDAFGSVVMPAQPLPCRAGHRAWPEYQASPQVAAQSQNSRAAMYFQFNSSEGGGHSQMVSTMWPMFLLRNRIGTPEIPIRWSKSTAFPSMTGMPATGPLDSSP